MTRIEQFPLRSLPLRRQGAGIAPLARLIALVAQAVPPWLPTIVLCDRGLQSRLLFETICAQGWHPMMRLTKQGYFRPNGQEHWYRLKDLLPGPVLSGHRPSLQDRSDGLYPHRDLGRRLQRTC